MYARRTFGLQNIFITVVRIVIYLFYTKNNVDEISERYLHKQKLPVNYFGEIIQEIFQRSHKNTHLNNIPFQLICLDN